MKKMKWKKMLVLAAITVLLASCRSAKYIYLEDMPVDQSMPITNVVETRVKKGDRLGINVQCKNMELAAPFNSYSYRATSQGDVDSGAEIGQGGYLVDKEGFINFPILGRLQVGGLTTDQVSDYVRNLLIEGKHIPDAVVETNITNFTVYTLGALGTGKTVAPEGHLNLLQLLAMSGDLQQRAQYKKVRVIREEDGKRMEFDVDVTTKDLYESPAYNLQQNDLVYAEPRKRNNQAFNATMTAISVVAVLASIAYTAAYIMK